MVILLDAEEAFNNIQTHKTKTLNKLGVKGNFFNLIKGFYKEELTAHIILNGEVRDTFPLRLGTR